MKLRRPMGATVVACALVATFAGCGSQHLTGDAAPSATSTSVAPPTAKRSATELVAAMRASAKKATSFKATGTVSLDFSDYETESGGDDGVSSASGTTEPAPTPTTAPTASAYVMKVDVAGATNGSSTTMTLTQDSATSTMLLVGDTTYFRGNADYFNESSVVGYDPSTEKTSTSESALAKYADRWISTPKAASSEDRLDHTLTRLLDETISTKQFPDAKIAAATVTPVVDEGVAAYRITIGASQLIIADDDAATLRYAVVSEPDETQTLRFSQWNSVPAITAPADAIPSSHIPDWDQTSMGMWAANPDSQSGEGYGTSTYGVFPSADAASTGEAFNPAEATSSAYSAG